MKGHLLFSVRFSLPRYSVIDSVPKGTVHEAELTIYHKIPKISSPWGLYFSKALFEGLIYGVKFAFQNRLG